ncbi:hypothetical protein PHBOTO_002381 [Pseudozyma hubeiensis]|nr:hypothetical protein PHBOTO_002381 [Pseudozyma hubeiensis]
MAPVTEEENKRIRAQRKARQERRKVEEASKQRKRKQKKQCKRKQSSVAVPGLESQQPVSASSAPTAAYGSAVRQQGSVTPVGADWPSSDESPYGSDTSLSSADPVTPLNGLSQAPGWPFPSQPAVPAYAVPHQQPFYADQNVPVQPMHQIRTSPEISCNLPYPSSSFINSAYDSTMPQSQPNVDWMAMQASNFDHREQPYQQQLQTSQQQPQYPHQHLQVQQFAFSAPLPNGGYSNDVYPTSAYSNGTHTYGL